MSNRTLKLKLWNEDPRCYWCKIPTVLTNTANEKLAHNTATVDHLISRYNPGRWLKKKTGQKRKVLACFACNQKRSMQETLCLSRAEILNRSKGYSLSPKGKPTFEKPVETLREIKKVLNRA
jgi:hypothetical protein